MSHLEEREYLSDAQDQEEVQGSWTHGMQREGVHTVLQHLKIMSYRLAWEEFIILLIGWYDITLALVSSGTTRSQWGNEASHEALQLCELHARPLWGPAVTQGSHKTTVRPNRHEGFIQGYHDTLQLCILHARSPWDPATTRGLVTTRCCYIFYFFYFLFSFFNC